MGFSHNEIKTGYMCDPRPREVIFLIAVIVAADLTTLKIFGIM